MLSESKIAYREMALVNMAHCYTKLNEYGTARDYYMKLKNEFPQNEYAEQMIQMIDDEVRKSIT